jgi:heme exporter protein A
MSQRLNLARILLLRPALLLLDEPSTGLDTRSRSILDKEIKAAGERGAGIVWISHSLDEDLPKADKLAVLAASRLDFFGSRADYAAYAAKNAEDSL